jgi:hypothetical protein
MGKPIALLVAATQLLHAVRAELRARGFHVVERTHATIRDVLSDRPSVAIVSCDGATPLDGISASRDLRQAEPLLPIILVAERTTDEYDLLIPAIPPFYWRKLQHTFRFARPLVAERPQAALLSTDEQPDAVEAAADCFRTSWTAT